MENCSRETLKKYGFQSRILSELHRLFTATGQSAAQKHGIRFLTSTRLESQGDYGVVSSVADIVQAIEADIKTAAIELSGQSQSQQHGEELQGCRTRLDTLLVHLAAERRYLNVGRRNEVGGGHRPVVHALDEAPRYVLTVKGGGQVQSLESAVAVKFSAKLNRSPPILPANVRPHLIWTETEQPVPAEALLQALEPVRVNRLPDTVWFLVEQFDRDGNKAPVTLQCPFMMAFDSLEQSADTRHEQDFVPRGSQDSKEAKQLRLFQLDLMIAHRGQTITSGEFFIFRRNTAQNNWSAAHFSPVAWLIVGSIRTRPRGNSAAKPSSRLHSVARIPTSAT